MENREQDLTVGSVPQKLIRFALPLFGANLLQSFYSIVDMLVVGRVVGKSGLAAISNASMISFIINSICIGVTMGGGVHWNIHRPGGFSCSACNRRAAIFMRKKWKSKKLLEKLQETGACGGG